MLTLANIEQQRYAWVEQVMPTGQSYYWRVRLLDPSTISRVPLLMAWLLRSATPPPESAPDPDIAAAMAAAKQPDPDEDARRIAEMQTMAIEAIVGVTDSDPGDDGFDAVVKLMPGEGERCWQAVRLVPDTTPGEDATESTPLTLPISILAPGTLGQVCLTAVRWMEEAAQKARSFRRLRLLQNRSAGSDGAGLLNSTLDSAGDR